MVDRRRGRKTILRSGQRWTLLAQLGQLKTGLLVERDCCKVICDIPTISEGYGID